MNKYFENLLLWEIILLFLGTILFLTLVGSLVYLLKKDKLKLSFAGFFFIPIIMIAFPSIRYINFLNGIFEINTATEKVEEHPEIKENWKKLEEVVNEKSGAAIRSEEQLVIEARANTLLKKYTKAEEQVEMLLDKDPENPEAKVVKSRIEVLKAQEELEKDSTNELARKKEAENIKVLERQDKIRTFDKKLIMQAKGIKGKVSSKVTGD